MSPPSTRIIYKATNITPSNSDPSSPIESKVKLSTFELFKKFKNDLQLKVPKD